MNDLQWNKENAGKGKLRSLYDEKDMHLFYGRCEAETKFHEQVRIQKGKVCFCFCTSGDIIMQFNPHYTRTLTNNNNYFLYQPEKDFCFVTQLSLGTQVFFLTMTLEHLHNLLLDDNPHFLKSKRILHQIYEERPTIPSITLALHTLVNMGIDKNTEKLYYQGKIFEILGLYFTEKREDVEKCPFLNDSEILRKIKYTKEYLLQCKDNIPGLREIAKKVGLNEYQLKVGFKEVYGDTVFGFLLNKKMERSHRMLDSGQHRVNEVAYAMGYSNPSHFIAAFKKKFGITPKKYLISRNNLNAS